MEAPAYQSLYRRYRPQRFDEVRGQDHVTTALRNAVREERIAHAYLFSGPRGTGKTSTARILAKALNCHAPVDGEPCGTCPSCIDVQAGSSIDVRELDAASNRRIDDVRELIASVALGTPGRWKVYIVDEVHMLTPDASAALLKTLEEPPPHVIFVLATTDPQKVLDTIRSRTQHFEFRLFPSDVLEGLLRDIRKDAGLEIDDESIDLAVRRGKGSARDAVSALEQVAAGGAVLDDDEIAVALVDAICDRDAAGALAAVARACAAGRDPRVVATQLLEELRNAFLALLAPDVVSMSEAAAARAGKQAERLGPAAVVRAMDTIGDALTDMRESLEPRVSLEVALVRITRPEVDTSNAAIVERLERLEHALATGAAGPAAPRQAAPPPGPPPAPPSRSRRPAGAPPAPPKAGVAARAAKPTRETATSPGEQPQAEQPQAEAKSGELPSRDDLTKAWGDAILASLSNRARARVRVGRFMSVGDAAVFALPNEFHREASEPFRLEVEEALAAHFGVRVPIRFVVESEAASVPAAVAAEDEVIDRDELVDATDAPTTPEDVLRQAFPGAEEVGQ